MAIGTPALVRKSSNGLVFSADPVPVRIVLDAVPTRDKHVIDVSITIGLKPGDSTPDRQLLGAWINSLHHASIESADVGARLSPSIRAAVVSAFERIRASEATTTVSEADVAHKLKDVMRSSVRDMGLAMVGSIRVAVATARHTRAAETSQPVATGALHMSSGKSPPAPGHSILVMGGTKLVRIIDAKPSPVIELGSALGSCRCVIAVTLDGKSQLIVGCRGGVHVVDTATGRSIRTLTLESPAGRDLSTGDHAINSVALISTGTRVLATHATLGLASFDLTSGAAKVFSHDAFESDDTHAPKHVIACGDGSAIFAVRGRIWKWSRDKVSPSTLTPGASIIGIEPSADGMFVVIRRDGRCDIIDCTAHLKSSFEISGEPTASSSCGGRVAIAKTDGRVIVGVPEVKLPQMRDQHTFAANVTTGPCRFVALSHDSLIVVPTDRNSVLMIDAKHQTKSFDALQLLGHRITGISVA